MSMAKSLLILMLVTTQLLAGSGGSLYLCISSDGTYCCIDTGPASCTCCHNHDKVSDAASCADHGCIEDSAAGRCEHHTDGSPIPGPHESFIGNPCGCAHVQLASADQTTIAVRSSIVREVEALAQMVAWTPRFGGVDDVAISPQLGCSGPPAVPDFRLTVVSTVVIRC